MNLVSAAVMPLMPTRRARRHQRPGAQTYVLGDRVLIRKLFEGLKANTPLSTASMSSTLHTTCPAPVRSFDHIRSGVIFNIRRDSKKEAVPTASKNTCHPRCGGVAKATQITNSTLYIMRGGKARIAVI